MSNDLATAAENGDFMNIQLFHDLFKDLFYNVTRLLTPLTLQNADKALQYCKVRTTRGYEITRNYCTQFKSLKSKIAQK